mgnify:CR=1 FL=1
MLITLQLVSFFVDSYQSTFAGESYQPNEDSACSANKDYCMVSMQMTHTSPIRIFVYSAYISQQYILRIGHYFCIYSALFGLRNTLFVSIQYTTSVNYGLKLQRS